jgi:hypothetical protein
MIFPSRRQLHESREVKYIGLDVHQEAVVIAVLNSSGKLVMESIVETKASILLQFIHGLRGELLALTPQRIHDLKFELCWFGFSHFDIYCTRV